MKTKYKHKNTGEVVERSNHSYYISMKDSSLIPDRFIEDSNDWEEVVEKDYEILSIWNQQEGDRKSVLSDSNVQTWINSSEFVKANWYIYSVKRLSDGEVFTIGDKVQSKCGNIDVIKELRITAAGDSIYVSTVGGSFGQNIKNIKKYVEPEVLFVTEDGVDITEGMKYWFLLAFTDKDIYCAEANTDLSYTPLHRFSTKEKALEFVAKKNEEKLLDSKVLSYNEVYKVLNEIVYVCGNGVGFNRFFDNSALEIKLKELVKSKQ